jgi:RNA polymerase sigma-70 factor (ECF subfamily)
MNDAALVAALRRGDERAFMGLVEAFTPGMRRFALTFVRTPAVADEVVQEAWLGVLRGLERFEGRSSLKTWVYRILVNTAKRRGMRESRTVPASSLGPTVDPALFQGPDEPYPGHWREPPQPWPTPEQHTLAAETRTFLADAIARLPDRQRVVLVLRDMQGYDADEVCSILDITAANQRVLLHRARAFVRGELAGYYTGTEVTT